MKRARKIQALPQLVDALVDDSRTVYLFFADLCGSTQYKKLSIAQGQPDINWIIRQNVFLQRCADLVRNYGGVVVKTIGDELFAYFEATTSSDQVLKCGIEIVQAFDNIKAYQGPSKLQAKISIDIGETYNGALSDNVPYDPIGSPVDRCARLNDQANSNEIMFSEEFMAKLKGKRSIKRLQEKYAFKLHKEDLQGLGETRYYCIKA